MQRVCVATDGSLGLAYVHPRDRGLYTCLASNTAGTAARSLTLEVKVRLTSSVSEVKVVKM